MEGSSSKGSSKRKPAYTMKVKLSKTRIQSDSDNENDYSDACQRRKNMAKGDNSEQSDVESIPDLPEGTVIVKPEAVKEKKPRFSGPEFKVAPENLDIVNCTACGRQINPNVSGAAKRHPDLKVLVCRKCYVYYRSGKIDQDEDGLDEQCRWCGEGGRLLGCDFCHNAFCKSCIIRNFSRAELTKVMADDGPKWKCYVCEPSKLKKLLQECDTLFEKIEKEKMKAKLQLKNADSSKKTANSKSSKSDGKSPSGKMHNKEIMSVSGITISSSNLVDTVSQLLGFTSGFQTMLEVLKSGLTACGDIEHSNRDLNRGAKTLENGLRQYLKSINDVIEANIKSKSAMENGETTEDESIVSNGVISLSDDEEPGRKRNDGAKSVSKPSSKCEVKKKEPVRRELKMNVSPEVVEIKDSYCSDDNSEDDLPLTFGAVGSVVNKEDKSVDVKTDEVKSSKAVLGETENEAAQLELLKELAEEMCKEQKGRKEQQKKEQDDKDTKKEKKEEKIPAGPKGNSSLDESDSTDDDSDDVSSSDLLMSSDSSLGNARKARQKKDKDRRRSRRANESKKDKKKRKKKERKESNKREKRKKDAKKKKAVDSESEEDLEKEIEKLEEEPEMKKKTKNDTESSDDDDSVDLDRSKRKKTEKNSTAKLSEEKKGKTLREKKKAESSSSDEISDVDDFDEEDEEESGTKMKNGNDKDIEEKNGDDLENELAKKALMAEIEDEEDEDKKLDDDEDDSDSDEKLKDKGSKKSDKKSSSNSKKKSDKETKDDEDTEDEDSVPKRKRIRSKLLTAKISDSDSDFKKKKSQKKQKSEDSDSDEVVLRKKSRRKKNDSDDESSDDESSRKKKKGRKDKKKKKGTKRKLASDSGSLSLTSSSSEPSDSEVSLDTSEEERREKRKAKRKAKGAKRRRIKQQENTSDEDNKKSDVTPDEDEDDDGDDETKSPDKSGRKNIRKIKSDKKLTDDTKRARKAEEARRKRVAERQKAFNHVVQIEGEISECPITTQLILEVDKETQKPIIEVNKKLVRKLKPHQVEACQFIWDCLCESLDRLRKKEGSGCILAHCMGLGKTLSVISFVHTMLQNEKLTKMRTCLIVCPLNTVINWRNEWIMWFDEKDQLDIYEISSIKQNWPRADYLKDWQEGGGIMVMGYEMYRNLTMGARIKNKKMKAIFQSTLVDPGPDLVVCDEGHILKNDASAVSQAMNKIRTRRRIVLTGTPLQNNLVEYHCMTSFVKPNLMGTRKEFLNRFVNPITNGQHSDSTAYDVKVMGRRAHVLHEMLAGCVQRRDYSALTKFLPPKFEYVISVRLTHKQIELYQKYLDLGGVGFDGNQIVTKGARLFSDYQNLMKIWTHPWVLKLSEIRAEQRMKYDDSEDSFIDNSSSEGEASMSNSDSDNSDNEKSKSDSDESQEAGPSSGPRRSRRGRPVKEDSDKDEVVKDWKTRSRGGEGDDDYPMETDDGPKPVSKEWWAEYVKEEDENQLELGGKLILLFEILRMCEEIGDKVLIFSQSLLSLNIIEYFLDYTDQQAQEEAHRKAKEDQEKNNTEEKEDDKDGDGEKKEEKGEEVDQTVFGKSWTKGADYFRMDGSTSPQLRSQWADVFNDPENFRARLFLISTRAGSLGINLVAANRVIIFDASWNPSHDVQSIFRVYRFGQTKPCYIYRFLAQGTMEEKIYERQVTKQSLSQRVVDEHQIDRHFTAADLTELYNFKPDRLDDPNREKVVHSLPKDVLLAELLKSKDTYICKFHEHDSLLENRTDQTLSEEDKKAAWEEYENERKGVSNRVAQASTASGMGMFSPDNVMQIVQMVKMRFPNLPPDMFQAQVQAILQQQILYQQTLQKQQIEQQRMMEMQRLHRIQQDIRAQQQQINMSRNRPMSSMVSLLGHGGLRSSGPGLQMRAPNMSSSLRNMLTQNTGPSGSVHKDDPRTPNQPPTVIDLSNS